MAPLIDQEPLTSPKSTPVCRSKSFSNLPQIPLFIHLPSLNQRTIRPREMEDVYHLLHAMQSDLTRRPSRRDLTQFFASTTDDSQQSQRQKKMNASFEHKHSLINSRVVKRRYQTVQAKASQPVFPHLVKKSVSFETKTIVINDSPVSRSDYDGC